MLLLGVAHLAKAASPDFVSLVNLFIGTASGANGGSGGNAFPGAAIPHAMAKVALSTHSTSYFLVFNVPLNHNPDI